VKFPVPFARERCVSCGGTERGRDEELLGLAEAKLVDPGDDLAKFDGDRRGKPIDLPASA
jgi:hypothetical protein